jgi:hypothetical protein
MTTLRATAAAYGVQRPEARRTEVHRIPSGA